MLHIDCIRDVSASGADNFIKKASGRYYTGEAIGRRLADITAKAFYDSRLNIRSIRVVDPFGGDARLIKWLIDSWTERGYPSVSWDVSIWDLDDIGFNLAKKNLKNVNIKGGNKIKTSFKIVDSFQEANNYQDIFDIVLTNPPWELLKPDRREIERLPSDKRDEYISKMRKYDNWISECYPISQPKTKFAGWGTNLSRVGLEVSLRIATKQGIVGIVLPASILADSQSSDLRKHLMTSHSLLDLAYFPAESKLYGKVDSESISLVTKAGGKPAHFVTLFSHHVESSTNEETTIELNPKSLQNIDFVLPISFGAKAVNILGNIADRFPKWVDLETDTETGLWAGREVDETRINKNLYVNSHGLPLFIKGRMIDRYTILESPTHGFDRKGWIPPSSVEHPRIVWRDVSRPSQKRRMIATIIPSGLVAGNSLGVAYFRDNDQIALRALLGLMNSTMFEFQLRAYLATGHVSLSSIRKVAVPPLSRLKNQTYLANLVWYALNGDDGIETIIDAYVAKNVYQVNEREYRTVLDLFDKVSRQARLKHLEVFRSLPNEPTINDN